MARPLRLQWPGATYHVITRGNARQDIFLDDDDRRQWLVGLDRIALRFDWRLLAYCLMPNHYHLCVATGGPTLVRGMRELNGVYAQAFNRRHARVGHLFQGRYKALVVDRDSYLRELARYIVLNPVRAGLCREPGEWRWSSYNPMMGTQESLDCLDAWPVLGAFAADLVVARPAFARFVAVAVTDPDREHASANPAVLGHEGFARRVVASAPAQSVEVPRAQRTVASLRQVTREARGDRDAAIQTAWDTGDFSLADIGRFFGLHYSTVSRICGRRRGWELPPSSGEEDTAPPIQDLAPKCQFKT
jgi:REP element-mobilizing transposase RayT